MPAKAPITPTTLLASPVPLRAPCMCARSPSCMACRSCCTPTTACGRGCPGSMALSRLMRTISRRMASRSSRRTCLTSPRSPSRRTLPHALSTWSAWPRLTCSSRWSSASPVARRTASTTLTSTRRACTLSPMRCMRSTRRSPLCPTTASPLPLPSATCTVCTLATSTSSRRSCTTRRSTLPSSSTMVTPSLAPSSSTAARARRARTSAMRSRPAPSR
mmetsp:Transcript_31962/g.63825  ORF Transcript_31962/g.63825 Transcript_31962/m.63825 type:complete len:218 (+) Transcript_31962:338-991(+)